MRNAEQVTVVAGGRIIGGWERVTVTAAIDEAVRSFAIEMAEGAGQFRYPPGTEVQIFALGGPETGPSGLGDLLCDGYTNAYEASGDHASHRINIRGRARGQDFVDSSAEHPTGSFEGETPLAIAKSLNRWPIQITADVDLEAIPDAQLMPGETPFQMLERYARPEGFSLMGEPDGSIRLTNASAATAHYGILLEGHTIKSFQVSLTDGSRHSRYIVRGQRRAGTGAASLRVKGEAKDAGVKRDRSRQIVNETDTDGKRAKRRAEHEKRRAAGKSVQAAVQTQGFRDFRGQMFAPNKTIYVHAPRLMHLTQTMLIKGVELTFDKSGAMSQLTLVDPRAFAGKGGLKGQAPGEPVADGDEETDPAWTEGY